MTVTKMPSMKGADVVPGQAEAHRDDAHLDGGHRARVECLGRCSPPRAVTFGPWPPLRRHGRIDDYFPNKAHQQIVNAPVTVLELDGSYDVLVRVHGRGESGG